MRSVTRALNLKWMAESTFELYVWCSCAIAQLKAIKTRGPLSLIIQTSHEIAVLDIATSGFLIHTWGAT